MAALMKANASGSALLVVSSITIPTGVCWMHCGNPIWQKALPEVGSSDTYRRAPCTVASMPPLTPTPSCIGREKWSKLCGGCLSHNLGLPSRLECHWPTAIGSELLHPSWARPVTCPRRREGAEAGGDGTPSITSARKPGQGRKQRSRITPLRSWSGPGDDQVRR